MFIDGRLSRSPGTDPRWLTFAVVDVETTGLYPAKGSRVCEIGIVRMRGDGVVLDEYSTLINPELRIGNDEFHGITNADVKGAPTFAQIAGDVLAYLDDAVVVGHNLEFEAGFLKAEFARLGLDLGGIVPGLCTLRLSRTQLDRYGYRLTDLANLITGEWPSASHSALGDARTLAFLLTKLIADAPEPFWWHGPRPARLPAHPRTGIVAPRAAGLRKGTDGWLATLTARLPHMAQPPSPRADALHDYRALLGNALADGRIVGEEAAQLAVLAARAGLTQTTARHVHEEFLADARARAEADGTVTTAELRELRRAAKELAASHLISDLEEAAAADRARRNGPLKGWRLLPVGDSAPVTDVIDFAVEQGATVAVNPTKTVRLVITDDVDSDDPRLAKARAAGIEIVTPDHARKLLSDETTRPDGKLFSDQDGQAIADDLAAERTAAAQPARPEWHTCWRARELSDAEYQARFVDRHDDWDDRQIVIRPAPPRPTSKKAPAKRGGCAVVSRVRLCGSGVM